MVDKTVTSTYNCLGTELCKIKYTVSKGTNAMSFSIMCGKLFEYVIVPLHLEHNIYKIMYKNPSSFELS